MPKKLEIYKCEKCGNIVEVINGTKIPLVCCGQNMKLMEEQTKDASVEKHVPYIEEIENGYKVMVGKETKHPMTEEHYIEWIELIKDNEVLRKELKPNDKPEAIFVTDKSENVYAREYCNIHGHWKS